MPLQAAPPQSTSVSSLSLALSEQSLAVVKSRQTRAVASQRPNSQSESSAQAPPIGQRCWQVGPPQSAPVS